MVRDIFHPGSGFRRRRPAIRLLGSALVAGLAVSSAQAQLPATGSVAGMVVDSLRGGSLRGALVRIEPGVREVTTDANGMFVLDSIAPGQHRVRILHPILDTIGVALVTPEFTVTAGQRWSIDVGVPSARTLLDLLCPRPQLLRGPGAVIGFVRDPDTDAVIDSATVSLVYVRTDATGFIADTIVRTAVPDAAGRFRICGLPEGMEGRMQVIRKDRTSGDIPVAVAPQLLTLRSLGFASVPSFQSVSAADTASSLRVLSGPGRLSGQLLDKAGRGVDGARISVAGTLAVAVTDAEGRFALDSLPTGSHTLEVRKLGFGVLEQGVDISLAAPARVTVVLGDPLQMLDAMRTVASPTERYLAQVGYTDRRRSGIGRFYDPAELNPQALTFSDAVRNIPGLAVTPVFGRRRGVITSTRDQVNGCVTFIVDGSVWQSMEPGDIDEYVRPDQVRGVEVYLPSQVPVRFARTGQGNCLTLVIWTAR
jgi:hypothetical protein